MLDERHPWPTTGRSGFVSLHFPFMQVCTESACRSTFCESASTDRGALIAFGKGRNGGSPRSLYRTSTIAEPSLIGLRMDYSKPRVAAMIFVSPKQKQQCRVRHARHSWLLYKDRIWPCRSSCCSSTHPSLSEIRFVVRIFYITMATYLITGVSRGLGVC